MSADGWYSPEGITAEWDARVAWKRYLDGERILLKFGCGCRCYLDRNDEGLIWMDCNVNA